jgi:hypothetical protein
MGYGGSPLHGVAIRIRDDEEPRAVGEALRVLGCTINHRIWSHPRRRIGSRNRSRPRSVPRAHPGHANRVIGRMWSMGRLRADPPDDVVSDTRRRGRGSRRGTAEGASSKKFKNFDTHLGRGFHGGTRGFLSRMRLPLGAFSAHSARGTASRGSGCAGTPQAGTCVPPASRSSRRAVDQPWSGKGAERAVPS